MTPEPAWILREALVIAHDEAIAEHRGASGLRDAGLLDSALTRVQNAWTYGESDLFALAAIYADAIVRNHPFVDGNKRAAFIAAATFLAINGAGLEAGEAEAAAMTIALAAGDLDAAAYADWLRDNASQPGA